MEKRFKGFVEKNHFSKYLKNKNDWLVRFSSRGSFAISLKDATDGKIVHDLILYDTEKQLFNIKTFDFSFSSIPQMVEHLLKLLSQKLSNSISLSSLKESISKNNLSRSSNNLSISSNNLSISPSNLSTSPSNPSKVPNVLSASPKFKSGEIQPFISQNYHTLTSKEGEEDVFSSSSALKISDSSSNIPYFWELNRERLEEIEGVDKASWNGWSQMNLESLEEVQKRFYYMFSRQAPKESQKSFLESQKTQLLKWFKNTEKTSSKELIVKILSEVSCSSCFHSFIGRNEISNLLDPNSPTNKSNGNNANWILRFSSNGGFALSTFYDQLKNYLISIIPNKEKEGDYLFSVASSNSNITNSSIFEIIPILLEKQKVKNCRWAPILIF